MARQKKSPEPAKGKKTQASIWIKKEFLEAFKSLVQRRASTMTAIGNEAIRLLLEQQGLWPPPEKS